MSLYSWNHILLHILVVCQWQQEICLEHSAADSMVGLPASGPISCGYFIKEGFKSSDLCYLPLLVSHPRITFSGGTSAPQTGGGTLGFQFTVNGKLMPFALSWEVCVFEKWILQSQTEESRHSDLKAYRLELKFQPVSYFPFTFTNTYWKLSISQVIEMQIIVK